jgi:6-phosphofructokinase 1
VINASLAGVIREAQTHDCFTGVYGLVHGIEGALKEELLDLGGETAADLDLLALTPASVLGSCRHKLSDDDYDRILLVFRAHNVRHFVYIGGNDSMDTCHRISQLATATGYEMQVMGVPKTVDNDLACTDHCPGYGSAARFLALASRDTGRDLESMATFDDVVILETMGRNAGWLTAASTLCKRGEDEAPHLVYVPELPFDEERFVDNVARVHSRLGRAFVTVSEGIRNARGGFVGQSRHKSAGDDAFGHVVHAYGTGVGAYLTDLVRRRLGLRARFLRPDLINRAMSSCVAETDRSEALQVGQQAVAHLSAGRTGYMVTLERTADKPYRCETGLASLASVANAEKLLPREFVNEAEDMVTEAFRAYALPLIDGPLPSLARLRGNRVPHRVTGA